MLTILVIICLCLIAIQSHFIFSIIFGAPIYAFMRMSKVRDLRRSGGGINDIPKYAKTAKPSLLVLYLTGFVRYYDYRVGRIPSHHIRKFIYKHIYLMDIADTATIYYGAQIRKPFKIKIGPGTTIGDNAILDGRNGIEIGSNVNLSSNVSIWTEQHDHRDPWFRCETQKKEKVIIGDRAWLGPNTIILHDVQIGKGAVVGAGAVVTKNVEDFTIVGGIPAKKIGERNHELLYDNSSGIYNPFL